MLAEARRHVQAPRVTFHHNPAPDLRLFDDHTFTFIYSTLVLQHMAPALSRGYVAEFLRVLAPRGLAVFQVPSRRVMSTASAGEARTAVRGRLPGSAYRAHIVVTDASAVAQAGDQLTVQARVENRSGTKWPAQPDPAGPYAIKNAKPWHHEIRAVYQRDDGRAPLPRDVGPGEAIDVILYVRAPQHDGHYWLELDLVQEDLDWFAAMGSTPTRARCTVTGGLAPIAAPPPPAASRPAEAPPFRERHPLAFGLFRATGVRNAYWTWRRAVDRVKHRRDRLLNWWAGVSFAPRMEMHCLPRADVEAAIAAVGGRTVAVDTEMTAGGYESCRYWVVR
jgi:hypothetical protein